MSKKTKLDECLGVVFKNFIALKDNDLKRGQEVFKSVFDQVKVKMENRCNYYKNNSSQVMYAGSVYDGIKVGHLDEFDMDIVIRLPVNYDQSEDGIIIENDIPGFVKMKIINGFDNLDKSPNWEKCNKVTRDWRDKEKYFLQNKFRQWMHSVVQKSINDLNRKVEVNGVVYRLQYKESGPAFTLKIRNDDGNEDFCLDVDLVPVIKFMHPRWPEGYRQVEGSSVRDWLVVPKPRKNAMNDEIRNRCWRLSFQEFEREMMKGCQHMKTTIRLVKKLRDALGMTSIASYYIKTLFLWKINDVPDKKSYWQNKLSFLFRVMVEELYKSVKNKNIPYFWHEDNNLLEGVRSTLLTKYEEDLKKVVDSINSDDVGKVLAALVTPKELVELETLNPELCEKLLATQPSTSGIQPASPVSQNESVVGDIKALNEKVDTMCNLMLDRIKVIEEKVDMVFNVTAERMKMLEDKMALLQRKLNDSESVENGKDIVNIY